MIIETFRETLDQMGVEPTGVDPVIGQPAYGLADVARAMGVPQSNLDEAMAAEQHRKSCWLLEASPR